MSDEAHAAGVGAGGDAAAVAAGSDGAAAAAAVRGVGHEGAGVAGGDAHGVTGKEIQDVIRGMIMKQRQREGGNKLPNHFWEPFGYLETLKCCVDVSML